MLALSRFLFSGVEGRTQGSLSNPPGSDTVVNAAVCLVHLRLRV